MKSKIQMNAKIFNKDLIEKLTEEKKNFIPARASTLPINKVDEILENIKKTFNLTSREEAVVVIALLFQQGGTARGCDGNMAIVIFQRTIKLADIRKILKLNSCNKAERKLARSLASEIQQIALIMETPGNLFSKIQKTNIDQKFTLEEKTWMSDFQSENQDCPPKIRTFILETFKRKTK